MPRDDINNAVKEAMKGQGRAQTLALAHGQFDAEECGYRSADKASLRSATTIFLACCRK